MGLLDGTKSTESLIDKKMKEAVVEDEFGDLDYSQVVDDVDAVEKKIVFVYGEKNDSKTTTALGILKNNETAVVLSFDGKSKRPMSALKFLRSAPITVEFIDAMRYYDRSTATSMVTSAEKTYKYVLKILDDIKTGKYTINGKAPDWIIFDATDELNSVLEYVMRKRNGLRPYEGVQIFLWKERNQYLDDIHDKSSACCNVGVIYTSYTEVKELVDNGTIMKRKDVPKWIGKKITKDTDILIRATAHREGKTKKFIATIAGSKYPNEYPDGDYDVTDRRLSEVLADGSD